MIKVTFTHTNGTIEVKSFKNLFFAATWNWHQGNKIESVSYRGKTMSFGDFLHANVKPGI